MKKIFNNILSVLMLLSSLFICETSAQFKVSGLYINDEEIPLQQGGIVSDVFDSLPRIEEIKEIRFIGTVTNENIGTILKELNVRPFNGLISVNFQYNYKLTAGVFSENKDSIQELVTLLRNPRIERVKFFGTMLADEKEGEKDIVAVMRYMVKSGVKNRNTLYEKVITDALAG